MNAIASFYAEEALRLAHERQAGYRGASSRHGFVTMEPRPDRLVALRSRLATVRAALGSVQTESRPVAPTLSNLPTRG